MSSWSEERRRDLAAADERRRKNDEATDRRRREQRRLDRDEKRAEKARKRLDRQRRRQARASRREKTLTPANIYGKGTLLLVTASAMASLPAQVAHFAGISWMLLPVPFALEGAAWVMAAGVAYADSRGLAVWVRWLLRVLALAAAGYAASINYGYGTTLSGLTAGQQHTAGLGLAAVTLGGPLLFEVRQWVLTLSADARARRQRADEKDRARHEKKRRKQFPRVADRADALMVAASYGALTSEQAFDLAWQQIEGAPRGVTADWYADRLDAEADMDAVLAYRDLSRERLAVDAFLADMFPPDLGGGGTAVAPRRDPKTGPGGGAAEGRTALGGKGKRALPGSSASEPLKPLAESDLEAVRLLAKALGGAERLSARKVREAIGCRNEYALRLRDAVRAEMGEGQ